MLEAEIVPAGCEQDGAGRTERSVDGQWMSALGASQKKSGATQHDERPRRIPAKDLFARLSALGWCVAIGARSARLHLYVAQEIIPKKFPCCCEVYGACRG